MTSIQDRFPCMSMETQRSNVKSNQPIPDRMDQGKATQARIMVQAISFFTQSALSSEFITSLYYIHLQGGIDSYIHEMCSAFIYYWPKRQINGCTSYPHHGKSGDDPMWDILGVTPR